MTMARPLGQEYSFTADDFRYVARLAKEHFGLNLPESKMSLIYSRLARRVRALGLADFAAYRALLADPAAEDERLELLSALTTNVTHFFRESHHFDTLRTIVLPGLITRAKSGGRVRLWSAGCSTGQEPFSIALLVLDLFPQALEHDFKILGTDIDPVVVQKAKAGCYDRAELETIPQALRGAHVTFQDQTAGTGQISSKARDLITFGTLNLIKPLPFSGKFDAIFCRNVTIYFDKPTQALVWQKFNEVLMNSGHLFIGHSERLSGPATAALKNVGITTYQKQAG